MRVPRSSEVIDVDRNDFGLDHLLAAFDLPDGGVAETGEILGSRRQMSDIRRQHSCLASSDF